MSRSPSEEIDLGSPEELQAPLRAQGKSRALLGGKTELVLVAHSILFSGCSSALWAASSTRQTYPLSSFVARFFVSSKNLQGFVETKNAYQVQRGNYLSSTLGMLERLSSVQHPRLRSSSLYELSRPDVKPARASSPYRARSSDPWSRSVQCALCV